MILSDHKNVRISDPSADDIRKVISSLSDENTSFAILEESQESFIQAAGTPSAGFHLEFMDGSVQELMVIKDHRLGTDAVVSAFVEFVNKLESYKHRYEWEKLETEDIEYDSEYTRLGKYDISDAQRLLKGLEEVSIRFGFDEEGEQELTPQPGMGIPVFVHRDDEAKALLIRDEVFNISI